MISFLPAAAQPAARELLMTPARRIILLLGVPLSLADEVRDGPHLGEEPMMKCGRRTARQVR